LRRLRRAALLSLALLSVFTLTAGVAVARMLPPRLALWHVPTVANRALAQAGPVLDPLPDPGPAATPRSGYSGPAAQAATVAGVSAALGRLLSSATLGRHVGAVVADLSSGQVLLSRQADSGFAPASTAKLGVAVAALHVLGPANTPQSDRRDLGNPPVSNDQASERRRACSGHCRLKDGRQVLCKCRGSESNIE